MKTGSEDRLSRKFTLQRVLCAGLYMAALFLTQIYPNYIFIPIITQNHMSPGRGMVHAAPTHIAPHSLRLLPFCNPDVHQLPPAPKSGIPTRNGRLDRRI